MKYRDLDLTTAERENALPGRFQRHCKGKEACFVVCLQQLSDIEGYQTTAAFQQLFCLKSTI